MKKIIGYLITAALLAVSCDGAADLEGRRDAAAGRLDALTGSLEDMNAELALLQAVASGGTVASVSGEGSNWEITLSNGTVLSIAKGCRPVGSAPVITLDADGFWQVDYGNGPVALTRPGGGKVGATGIDFTVPVFGVDAGGFWTVSLDGGTTFAQLRDTGGSPVKALPDGGVDSFFSDVSFDGTTLTLTLRGGSVYSAPVAPEFSFSIVSGGSKVIFAPGEIKELTVTSSGVQNAIVYAPSGWAAAITDGKLKITAPAATRADIIAQASTDVAVLAVSERGYSTIARVQVEVDPTAAAVPEDRLETWNEGGALYIAGKIYSRLVHKDAVVLKATSADQPLVPMLSNGALVYFLEQEDGCNFALTGEELTCDAVLVSRYSNKQAVIRFKATTPFSDRSLAVKDVLFDARAASVTGFTLSASAIGLSHHFHFDGCRFNWKYNKNLISLNQSTSNGGIYSIRIVNSAIDMRADASATRMTFILTQNNKYVGEMEELFFENNRVAYDKVLPFNIAATGSSSRSSSGGPVVRVRNNTFRNATPAQTLVFIDTMTSYDISSNIWSVPSGTCGGYLVRTTVAGVSATGTMSDNYAYGTEGTLYTFHTSSTFGTREKIDYVASDPIESADQDAMRFIPASAYSAFGAK